MASDPTALGRRRRLLGLLAGLAVSVVMLAPAGAQDRPDSATGDGGETVEIPVEETVEVQADETVEGQVAETPDAPGEPTSEQAAAGIDAGAVDDGDRTIQILESDVSAFPEVRLVAAVPPALAGELSRDSFGLTENGSLRFVDVAKLRDTIEVVVVIDTSGSMAGAPIDAATAAAADFVAALDPETRVAVIGFGAVVETAAGFDATRRETNNAIAGLEAGGETALYDALVAASQAFGPGDSRRFVVVLSDGTDTASTATLREAAGALDTSGASLYAITLESEEADFRDIRDLAGRVDGQVVAASDSQSLTGVYAAIASRLTNQYRITYESRSTGTASVVLSVEAGGVLATAADQVDLGVEAPSTSDGQAVAPPVITIAEPTVVVAPDTGFLQSSAALYLGGGVLFLAVGAALFIAMSVEPKGPSALERLNMTRQSAGATRRSGLSSIADRASSVAERVLDKQSSRGALDAKLEKAGMDMRPGEFIVASMGGALGFAALGFVMMGPLQGLIGLLVGGLGGRMILNRKLSKRQRQFAEQLGDTLMMIAGSLRAGHGIAEALDTVASQSASPTAEEFGRAVSESRIGRDMVESLYDIAERTGSEDFIWVVRAISINRELGGDLAEILDNVGETIRDRNRLRDQVRALSAEGKVSAMILFAMPVLVAIWVQISNPEYMASMTDQTAGKFVVGFAVMLLLVGGAWLKKLVNVEF
ncbi:MAG: type II secretion system F family protein [Acidimicrobiales bacterium]